MHAPSLGLRRFHCHAANFLLLLAGRKSWWFIEPDTPGNPRLMDTDPGLSHADACGFDDTPPVLSTRQQYRRMLRTEQEQGEALFLPTGWFHATCNRAAFNLGVGAVGFATGWTTLATAAKDGDLEIVERVLGDHGVDTEAVLLRETAGKYPADAKGLQAG